MAFLFVSAMTGGGPNNASNVALLYMYNQKNLGGGYGYAMAIGRSEEHTSELQSR